MAKLSCDFRFLLIPAVILFIYVQMRLFATQSGYTDRIAEAMHTEQHCKNQMRLLSDQISMQQEQIVALKEGKRQKEQECAQLKALVQDLEKKSLQRIIDKTQVPVAAVVIMACNRADYLEKTIASVLKYQSSVALKYPLFVSQDGSDPSVRSNALSYNQLTYMQHLDYDPLHTERPGELITYYKIARHYKWALDELFYKHNFDRVIILEDDMEIAPDFFDYFEAAVALLDKDKSIMAISSWNDNGQKQFVHDPCAIYTQSFILRYQDSGVSVGYRYVSDIDALYRSDFFPGLGWMLTRSTWNELSPKWPKAYWDDWLRLKENHRGFEFLRPEVCRTYNFGEDGSSIGQFFRQYLEPIKMNDVKVDWKSQDLSYLTENKYTKNFNDILKKATPILGTDAVLKASNIKGDVRIQYKDQSDFERIARQFGIFEEWKDGIPRTAYKGVVVFRYQPPRRVFLVGPDSLRLLGI